MSDFFSALAPLHSALDYHLERHSVLSSNVAHVDTPGYKPSDLARVEDVNFNSVFGVELAKTQAGHMPGAQGAEGPLHGRVFQDLSAGVGNAQPAIDPEALWPYPSEANMEKDA